LPDGFGILPVGLIEIAVNLDAAQSAVGLCLMFNWTEICTDHQGK
jgi:hypothetical protein